MSQLQVRVSKAPYENLVFDCRSIIKETELKVGDEVLVGYFKLGSRLHEERKESLPTWEKLASDIGNIGHDTLWKAWRLVEKYPKIDDFLREGRGKSSIHGLFNKFFPKPALPSEPIEPLTIPSYSRILLKNIEFQKANLAPESIDMVLTDPPYANNPQLWKELGHYAKKWLKPGGVLATYAGQTYLIEELNALSQSLKYVWTLATIFGGNTDRMHQIGAHVGWKPILVFCKPPWKIREFNDTLNGPRSDKRFHDWGQPVEEATVLLEDFSKPGDMVLDPMVGGGTTIEACINMKRHCIAYEKDSETFRKLEQRFPSDNHEEE